MNIMKKMMIFYTATIMGCAGKSAPNETPVANKIQPQELVKMTCGKNGIQDFIIEQSNQLPLNYSLTINEVHPLNAKIICAGIHNVIFVTDFVDWSSDHSDIVRVGNESSVGNKGVLTTIKPGQAIINVKFGIYQASTKLTITNQIKLPKPEALQLDYGRNSGILLKGETLELQTYQLDANGNRSKITPIFSTDDVGVVSVDGNHIKGIESGSFTIKASYENKSVALSGNVSSSHIVGVRILEDNLKSFSSELPKTIDIKAQFVLSDGTFADIPTSTLDAPNSSTCELYNLPSQSATPFVSSKSSCQITSTINKGSSRLSYKFQYLLANGQIDKDKPIFESSINIKVSDAALVNLRLELSESMEKILIGKPYRYRIFAETTDHNFIDVTKIVSLSAFCQYGNTDCTKNILVAKTGYSGPINNSQDDRLGGFIQFVNSVGSSKNNEVQNIKLQLRANLSNHESAITLNAELLPNVWTVGQLSNYFVTNVYPYLSPSIKKMFFTFNSLDSNAQIISNNYYMSFIPVKDEQLYATPLLEMNTIVIAPESGNTVILTDSINLPRANEYDTADSSYDLGSILCNSSDYNQTLSSSTSSKSLSSSWMVTRGLSLGLDTDFSVPFLNKTTLKMGYSEQWGYSDTVSTTYTLPAQNITMTPHSKAIVLQKMYTTILGGTKQFSVPLNSIRSCIPFTITANLPSLSFSSNACLLLSDLPFSEMNNNIGDFRRLFSNGDMSLNFEASYKISTVTPDSKLNGVAIYLYQPGSVGYDQITCPRQRSINELSREFNKFSISDKEDGHKLLLKNGQTIPLNSENLISMQFSNY